MATSTAVHRVVVIGGGYAGTAAANRLRKRPDVDVTRVNPRPEFVQRIRLHQFVADSGRAVNDYRDLLADGVRLVVDQWTRIDTSARTRLRPPCHRPLTRPVRRDGPELSDRSAGLSRRPAAAAW